MSEEKPVVVYDGECSFCIQQVENFKSLDSNEEIEYVPRQDPTIASRFPILTDSKFDSGMRFVRADGSVDVGADAVYQIAKRLPAYKPLAWIYTLPVFKQIARAIFGFISANRQRLAAKKKSG